MAGRDARGAALLARQAMHASGEEIHVAGWPGVEEMRQVAFRGYAFEGRCFVLAVGSILRWKDLPPELPPRPEKAQDPDAFMIRGGSAIIAPNGRYLAGPGLHPGTGVGCDCGLAGS